jgi:hypothetical protein
MGRFDSQADHIIHVTARNMCELSADKIGC